MSLIIEDLKNITNVNQVTKNSSGNFIVNNSDENAKQGLLDTLLNTAILHLDAQFSSGRIRNENYASAFVQIYQATLQTAVQIFLQKDLVEVQIEGAVKDNELKDKQKDLTDAQIAQLQEQTKNLTKDLELKDKDGLIKDEQKNLIKTQKASEEEKTKLYKRQIIGFDDQKVLQTTQTLLDTYNVFLSTAQPTDNQPFPNIFVEYFKRNSSTPIQDAPNNVKCMAQLDTIIGNLIHRSNTITDVTQPNGGITIIPDIPQTE